MAITLDGTTGITTPGLTNTGTETIVNLTTTGNTILGDASTDTLNVGNGGLVKDASGNVGIGTASPQKKFVVSDSGAGGLEIDPNDAGSGNVRSFAYNRNTSAYINHLTQALNFRFYTGTTPTLNMTLDSSGNLGLGVTPSAWRSTQPTIQAGTASFGAYNNILANFAQNMYVDSSNVERYITSTWATQYYQYLGTHAWRTAPIGTAGNAITFTEAMRLDASGNLGIGVTPSAWSGVKVMQYGTSAVANLNNNAYFGTNWYFDGTNNRYIATAASSRIDLSNGGIQFQTTASGTAGNVITYTQAMGLDVNGSLLVGTTSSGISGWNVGKSIVLNSDYSATGAFSVNSTSSTGAQYFMAFGVGGTSRGSISSTTSGTTYGTTSDYRLKENVEPMIGALDTVSKLKPVTYTWKEDGADGQGFIAHELAEVCPQAVTGEKDAVDAEGNPKYQGIDTSFLVATLTAAIQEQQAMIDELKAKVAALEAA